MSWDLFYQDYDQSHFDASLAIEVWNHPHKNEPGTKIALSYVLQLSHFSGKQDSP